MIFLLETALLGTGPLRAADADARSDPSTAEAKRPRYARTVSEYVIPDVTLVDQAGRSARLAALLSPDRPIALNFFFASCRTICPVMTSTFAQMRKELGHDGDGLRVVSVTIDPDQDTPEVLKGYAERFSAGDGWTFLTGDAGKILDVQRAFFADTGGKFNHKLLYLFRAAGSKSWVRVEGLANAADLAGEVRGLVTATR
jgi:protein SCO1/2